MVLKDIREQSGQIQPLSGHALRCSAVEIEAIDIKGGAHVSSQKSRASCEAPRPAVETTRCIGNNLHARTTDIDMIRTWVRQGFMCQAGRMYSPQGVTLLFDCTPVLILKTPVRRFLPGSERSREVSGQCLSASRTGARPPLSFSGPGSAPT